MEGCCSPLFPLLEEARGHGKDVSSAAALAGHHDAHICAPDAPLHDKLERGQLISVYPVYAVHWAAVNGILQQQYALILSRSLDKRRAIAVPKLRPIIGCIACVAVWCQQEQLAPSSPARGFHRAAIEGILHKQG